MRQSGDEKLKYVLIFYTGGTCHVISRMRNDDSALCLWAYDVWGAICRKPLEIEIWVQRVTNRKWPILSPMVTWPMTSRDPERSRSWPQYAYSPISRKRLEIETWRQWTTYRKWPPWNKLVTWPMTSRDPERLRSWPHYVWCPLSRKRLEIHTWWQYGAPIGNGYLGIKWANENKSESSRFSSFLSFCTILTNFNMLILMVLSSFNENV